MYIGTYRERVTPIGPENCKGLMESDLALQVDRCRLLKREYRQKRPGVETVTQVRRKEQIAGGVCALSRVDKIHVK